MPRRLVKLGAAILIAGSPFWGATRALADVNNPTPGRPHLVAAPEAPSFPLLARGGGGDELYAGNPTCIPNTIDNGVGIQGGIDQECGDGSWLSLAYPVLTGGATIESINIVLFTDTDNQAADLYLMGDCGGSPDVEDVFWFGCGCVSGAIAGEITNHCLGELIVDPPAIVWVVVKRRDSGGGVPPFFVAFDENQQGPGHGYGNLLGSGNCGDWVDLDDFGFGGCAWVSLVTAGGAGMPECCDSPAQCDGDANGDGFIDPLDTGAILARFGLDASDPANCQYDVNCDGLIDPLDSGYVLARFGTCNEPVECPIGGGIPGECGGDPPGGCGESCGVSSARDCCVAHSDPGCDAVCGVPVDGSVEQCVCDFDDFCCTVTWDSACVGFVEELGCADCSATNPDCVE